MRPIKLQMKAEDRQVLEQLRRKGVHLSREVNRAHILLALDRQIPVTTISSVLGVERTAIWRTVSAYREKGLDYALHDVARQGAPRTYQTDQEAEVVALACSQPPEGAKRWTIKLLTQASRERPGMKRISRESIRRILKKTSASLGAK